MKIDLTKKQIQTLKFALYLASLWEDSVYDSNRVDLEIVDGHMIHVVPKGLKRDANKAIKNSKDFQILHKSLFKKEAAQIRREKP
jgi:hypothetical protein